MVEKKKMKVFTPGENANILGLKFEVLDELHATWDEEAGKYIKHRDVFLREADGGSISCPRKIGRPGVNPSCGSNCAFFLTVCNIPGKLGMPCPPIV